MDLVEFKKRFGFHDHGIEAIEWDLSANRLVIRVDDIHANQEGFPGDPGRQRGELVFEDVENLEVSIRRDEAATIDHLTLERDGTEGKMVARVDIFPDGRIGIECRRAFLRKI